GTKWSNGDPVTAKDFVYSWQRTVNPKTASQYGYLFSGIKNADAIQANKKSYKTLGVKAEGDYKLVVNLEKKIPYFKLLMGFPLFFPQNQKVVEKYGNDYGTKSSDMVYNGPFKL
ncbi:peptide ABC transporter substrate-binding protein, partial [Lactobacillus parabuchneri]|nr:peptide ABC transporter substrate-binding protein [Lentilactobacillus parabuchneri]